MVHDNIYPIYELLEYMKGLVLWNKNCRILMTRGSRRIMEMSIDEGPVICYVNKALNQTDNSLQ